MQNETKRPFIEAVLEEFAAVGVVAVDDRFFQRQRSVTLTFKFDVYGVEETVQKAVERYTRILQTGVQSRVEPITVTVT